MLGSAVFRTGIAPGGTLAGPWVRNPLWTAARAVPSLDLRFAENKSLVDATTGQNLVTFTRASSGTYVDSQGVIKTAANDVPRFDHNPTTGESLGLLVEESRTNLFQKSEEFEDTYWSKTNAFGTVIANQATSPDGASTADLYQEGTANAARYLSRSISFTSGTSYTISIWAKQAPGATRYLGLILPAAAFGANVGCAYTLSDAGTATIAVSGTNTTASIQAFPGGWYRCVLSSQATITTSIGVQIRLSNSPVAAAVTYTGDGSSGLYIWGVQLEAGSFPTSYIPTTTATVTRSADVASISGSNFPSWYRQDEGTIFVEGAVPVGSSGSRSLVSIDDGTTAERIQLGHNGTTAMRSLVIDGGATQFNPTVVGNSFPPGEYRKLALAVKASDFAAITTPGTVAAVSSGTMPTPTQLQIGFGPAQTQPNLPIKRLTYFPVRLANDTLQRITQ